MRYFYYPGCSLEGTAMEYNASTQAVMRALGVELMELEDWTCCGASAAEPVSYLLSMALPSRNLALAQKKNAGADLLVPCSACYLNLKKVEDHVRREEDLIDRINDVLSAEGLHYKGGVKVRHLLDVLAHDIGPERVKERVKQELSGLRIAPYYGCQCLRPYQVFDDPQRPTSMEPLIQALGAEVFPWEMGAKCCGAGLMTTKKDLALELTGALLSAAQEADCVATVCPMCQMNLDGYQKTVSRKYGKYLDISVLYLPQIMGLAFGLSEEELGLRLNFAFSPPLRSKLKEMGRSQVA